jgi:hypothetical protein
MDGVALMKYFYNSNTEAYWETITDPSDKTVLAYPSGTVEVTQRPSHLHTHAGGAWVAPSDAVYDEWKATEVRAERDSLLASKVDRVVSNPLRWASMSAETQAAWSTYRQALLDIPQQAGFPRTVSWPVAPSA